MVFQTLFWKVLFPGGEDGTIFSKGDEAFLSWQAFNLDQAQHTGSILLSMVVSNARDRVRW